MEPRITIALQKSGRLSEKSINLLEKCGLDITRGNRSLVAKVINYPVDLLFLRDGDITEYVREGVCDLGIVGENVLFEKMINKGISDYKPFIARRLGYGTCRLSVAVPNDFSKNSYDGCTVATSYPGIVNKYFKDKGISVKTIEMAGSVEVTPSLGVCDIICDIVSSGETLKSNGLTEREKIMESESLLIMNQGLDDQKMEIVSLLLKRIDGVLRAKQNKYIMMNAKRSSLEKIREVLPGLESPSVLSLDDTDDMVAIHAVCKENIFWKTMERLQEAGASSVLVMPIEKIIE